MNYYPHHIGDYLRDTAHLAPLEDGIYRRMLDVYYASEKPLPIETQWVCKLVRAHTDQEIEAVHAVLKQFFEKFEDGWHNKRADEEIRKARKRIKVARINGKYGGRPKTQRVSENNPVGSQPETQRQAHQKPKPKAKNQRNNTSAFALPDWVSREEWEAFEESRQKLRKPMTDRARTLILASLLKLKQSGHDPASVLSQSVRKGWLDVFPLKDQPAQQAGEVI